MYDFKSSKVRPYTNSPAPAPMVSPDSNPQIAPSARLPKHHVAPQDSCSGSNPDINKLMLKFKSCSLFFPTSLVACDLDELAGRDAIWSDYLKIV